jgi:class 3 adenylate cyclase
MNFPNATVFESDIVGYTKLVSNWPAQRTLHMLNELFNMFDMCCARAHCEKIETIGQ